MKCLRLVLAVSVLGLGIAGCYTNPVTGRKELSLVPQNDVLQLGLSSFDQLKKEQPINHDPAVNAQVQRVGKRLAAVAQKDMPDAKWEFVVFENKEPNAFCLPGGKVGVNTGILPITQDDAGLATVLGHEIGHATAHHANERLSEAQLLQAGSAVAGVATGSAAPLTQEAVSAAFGIGGPLAVELPHSRKQESEADRMGLTYMARAGYDPKAALSFWERFAAVNKQQGGSKTPEFLSTHPLDEKRIAALQKELPQAEQVYQVSKSAAGASAPAGGVNQPVPAQQNIISSPPANR